MKKVTLSLVAISVLGSLAFAESVKYSGDAKLFYSAVNSGGLNYNDKENNLFDVAGSLKSEIKFDNSFNPVINWGLTAVSNLNSKKTGTWITHKKNDDGSADENTTVDAIWLDTLNLTFNPFANTTMIIGRQKLDTPMVFSEEWNIASNSYDAVVLANTYFPKTTLVAAYVDKSNVGGIGTVNYLSQGRSFKDFGTKDGAYAFAIVNKSFCDTTLQAWYFNVVHLAKVAWLQADSKYMGIDYGLQYANLNPDASGAKTGTAVAGKIGGSIDGIALSAAYSTVSDDGQNFVNVGGGQSKLYTDAWWNIGTVAQPNTKAYTLTASYDFGIVNSSLYYTASKQSKSVANGIANETKLNETTLTFDKSFGKLDTSFAFVNTQTKVDGVKQASDNEIQAYLTYHF